MNLTLISCALGALGLAPALHATLGDPQAPAPQVPAAPTPIASVASVVSLASPLAPVAPAAPFVAVLAAQDDHDLAKDAAHLKDEISRLRKELKAMQRELKSARGRGSNKLREVRKVREVRERRRASGEEEQAEIEALIQLSDRASARGDVRRAAVERELKEIKKQHLRHGADAERLREHAELMRERAHEHRESAREIAEEHRESIREMAEGRREALLELKGAHRDVHLERAKMIRGRAIEIAEEAHEDAEHAHEHAKDVHARILKIKGSSKGLPGAFWDHAPKVIVGHADADGSLEWISEDGEEHLQHFMDPNANTDGNHVFKRIIKSKGAKGSKSARILYLSDEQAEGPRGEKGLKKVIELNDGGHFTFDISTDAPDALHVLRADKNISKYFQDGGKDAVKHFVHGGRIDAGGPNSFNIHVEDGDVHIHTHGTSSFSTTKSTSCDTSECDAPDAGAKGNTRFGIIHADPKQGAVFAIPGMDDEHEIRVFAGAHFGNDDEPAFALNINGADIDVSNITDLLGNLNVELEGLEGLVDLEHLGDLGELFDVKMLKDGINVPNGSKMVELHLALSSLCGEDCGVDCDDDCNVKCEVKCSTSCTEPCTEEILEECEIIEECEILEEIREVIEEEIEEVREVQEGRDARFVRANLFPSASRVPTTIAPKALFPGRMRLASNTLLPRTVPAAPTGQQQLLELALEIQAEVEAMRAELSELRAEVAAAPRRR